MQYEQSPFTIDYSISGLVRMNLNENLVLPADWIRKAARECEMSIDSRFYPSELDDGEMKELRSLIAEYCDSKEWMVELGCGSDQLIDFLCRMKLSETGSKLVTVNPTFSMYSLRAMKCGAGVVEIPLKFSPKKDDQFPLSKSSVIKGCRSTGSKLLALASPNNPTGAQYDLEDLREILEGIPSNVFALVDEAYVEFARYSVKSLLRKYSNLIMLRTFSKAFGLASHRIGYMVSANREFVDEFEDGVQCPFPLTSMSARLASKLLKQKQIILSYALKTKKLRGELIESLARFDGQDFQVITRSDGNFVLLMARNSERISKSLLTKYKIAVKCIPNMISNRSFIRITVGTSEMNSKVIDALGAISRS